LTAGIYFATATDINGCTNITSVTVTQPQPLTVNIINITNPTCRGANNGTLTAAGNGGTPGYAYYWSNGQFAQTATGLSPGLYTVTIVDQNGCRNTTNASIVDPDPLNVDVVQYSNYNGAAITCPGAADGAAQAVVSGGVQPYSFLWSGPLTQTTQIATGLLAGSYAVTLTDAGGCVLVDSITLLNPVALQATETHQNLFCQGDCDGQIIVTATAGTGTLGVNGYEYRIFGPGQLGGIFSSTNNFFNLCAGTFTVEVRDGNNCILPLSITLTEPPLLTATANSSPALCNGTATGQATANPTGGTAPYSYLWDNNETTVTATGLSAGTHSVTITDANGCQITAATLVTEPSLLTASTSFVSPSCFGSADAVATVLATGGTAPYSYAWSTGSGSASALGLPAGVFFVSVTDANGCSVSSVVTVTEPAVLTLTLSASNLICANNNGGQISASPSGGTAPYSYLWNNGQTTATATGLAAGTYTVFVTDARGCQTNGQSSLSQPVALNITLDSVRNASCDGSANGSAFVSAQGGIAPYTYLWSDGQTTAAATGLASGTYSLTVTDANGCANVLTASVTDPVALQIVQITNTAVSCRGGNDGSAAAVVNGGVSPYNFFWSNGQTGQISTGLAAGAYQLTVTDRNACVATQSFVITEPISTLLGLINSSDALCTGSPSGQLTAVITGGTPAPAGDYSYQWSNGESTAILANLVPGVYSLTVTDANGCSISLQDSVGEAAPILLTLIDTTAATCPGAQDGAALVTASGGTGTLSFQWSNGQTGVQALGLAANTYQVTVTDVNGCSASLAVLVTEGDSVRLTMQQTNASCYGRSDARLFVSSAGLSLFNWSNGRVGNPLNNITAGQYILTVTDVRGCVASFVYNVTQPDSLVASILIDDIIPCHNDSIGRLSALAVGGTPNYLYRWSNGNNTRINNDIPAGNYTLVVIDANGCRDTISQTLSNPAPLLIQAQAEGVRCVNDSNGIILVTASGGSIALNDYEFSLDAVNWQQGNLFPNLPDGIYRVAVRDNNGCIALDTVQVDTAPAFVFTAFSSDTTIIYGDTLRLFAEVNDSNAVLVHWMNLNTLEILDTTNQYFVDIRPFEEYIYQFTATSPLGCVIDSLVTVRVDKPRRVGAPQAFTPNNDGHNDWFFIQGDDKAQKVTVFRIYDRWGELVFEGLDLDINNPQQGWNGTFKGEKMNSGVYAWYAEVAFIDGQLLIFRGDVSILR
jgi:gliding motility-associated-like protein